MLTTHALVSANEAAWLLAEAEATLARARQPFTYRRQGHQTHPGVRTFEMEFEIEVSRAVQGGDCAAPFL